jgi:hypothetical protein
MSSSKLEHSSRRSQTVESLSNKNRSQSVNESQPKSLRSRLVPSTRATSANRHNKLYRGPPTPPPDIQFERERSFVLDCKAVSNISNDYSTANPKLGSVIPPYDSQLDPHTHGYFQFFGIPKTLERSGQVYEIFIISLNVLFPSYLYSQLIMSLLLVVFMIDFIQMVMVFVIYHFEINLVQVNKKKI